MSIREQALAARRAAELRVSEQVRDENLIKRERLDAEAQRLLALVRQSPLHEWFPLADWEAYALPSSDHWQGMRGYESRGGFKVVQLAGIVCADRPGGTDPEWAGVPCFGISAPEVAAYPEMDRPETRPGVFYCHTRYDEGYTSWEGSRVRSLEELGERIERWEATPQGKAAAERAAAERRHGERVA